jgi:hypothetical protein
MFLNFKRILILFHQSIKANTVIKLEQFNDMNPNSIGYQAINIQSNLVYDNHNHYCLNQSMIYYKQKHILLFIVKTARVLYSLFKQLHFITYTDMGISGTKCHKLKEANLQWYQFNLYISVTK